MGKKENLLARLHAKPSDFKWSEVKTLLCGYGFKEIQGSGSRVKFYNAEHSSQINLHKPHGSDPVKKYVVRDLIEGLDKIGIKP
jgi:hypothetical protein